MTAITVIAAVAFTIACVAANEAILRSRRKRQAKMVDRILSCRGRA